MPGTPSCKHFFQLFCREWFAEQVPLTFMAVMLIQKGQLLIRFYAFRYHFLPKARAHVDHSADDNTVVLPGGNIAHE